MPTSTQEAVVNAIREMHFDISRLANTVESILSNVRGLYRRAKPGPVQPPLPGLAPDDSKNDAPDGCEWTMPEPGEIARSLPRRWCNSVKVYDALWALFAAETFFADALFEEKARAAVKEATGGRVRPQTAARMLTALVRAGAAQRLGRGAVRLAEPTDELRAKVEAEADKLNAHRDHATMRPSDHATGREAAHA